MEFDWLSWPIREHRLTSSEHGLKLAKRARSQWQVSRMPVTLLKAAQGPEPELAMRPMMQTTMPMLEMEMPTAEALLVAVMSIRMTTIRTETRARTGSSLTIRKSQIKKNLTRKNLQKKSQIKRSLRKKSLIKIKLKNKVKMTAMTTTIKVKIPMMETVAKLQTKDKLSRLKTS